jgi:hypothetical protein
MLRFLTVSRLALSPNLVFEIGSSKRILGSVNKRRDEAFLALEGGTLG